MRHAEVCYICYTQNPVTHSYTVFTYIVSMSVVKSWTHDVRQKNAHWSYHVYGYVDIYNSSSPKYHAASGVQYYGWAEGIW